MPSSSFYPAFRYPADFAVNGPSVDYLEMQFIRRDYSAKKVEYFTEPSLSKILINVPQKVTEAISQQFNQSALGETGNFFAGKSNAGEAVRDALKRTAENFLLDKSVDVANKLGATGLSSAGLLSATTGVVFNPNLEVLYEGPDFRRFNFQFNLFTKSKQDAEAIYAIVETLRVASLPLSSAKLDNKALTDVFTDTAAIGAATAGVTTLSNVAEGAFKGKFDAEKTALGGAGEGLLGSLGGFVNSAGVAIGAAGASTGLLFDSGSRFITQPPFILIRYMRGADEHPFIRPLLPAAIDQVNFDFTPTGNYTTVGEFNADPKATTVGVTITMQLTEVTNLFADKLFNDRAPGVL